MENFIKTNITISVEIAKVLPANETHQVDFWMISLNQIEKFKQMLIENGVRKHSINGHKITINASYRAIGSIYKSLGFSDWSFIQSSYTVGHSKFYKTRTKENFRFILFNAKTKQIKMSETSPFRVNTNNIERGKGSNSHWLAKKLN